MYKVRTRQGPYDFWQHFYKNAAAVIPTQFFFIGKGHFFMT